MDTPEYYITTLSLSSQPNLTGVRDLTADYQVERTEVDICETPTGLTATYELAISLFNENPAQKSQFIDLSPVVEIDIEVMIFMPGEADEFKPNIKPSENWIHPELRRKLESGLVTDVLAPVSLLINNSARGVLPGISLGDV